MKKINFQKYKLRIRMAITNTLLAILPLIVFSVITYGVFINDSGKLLTSTLTTTFEQMNERMDEYFESVNNIIKTFAFDTTVQGILQNDPTFSDDANRERVSNQLKNIILINSAVSDGYLVTNSGDIIGTSENISKKVIGELILKSRDKSIGTSFLSVEDENGKKQIAAVKPVRNVSNLKELGYVVMTIDKNKLLKIFDSKIKGVTMNFLIADSSGNPVVLPDSNVKIPVGEIHKSMPDGKDTCSDSININGVKHKYIIHKSSQTEWELMVVVAERELYGHSLSLGYNILIYILVIVFIVIALTTVTNFRITKPITKLADAIDRVASGDTKHKISFSDKNEITMIADNFNHMVDEVQAAKQRIFSTQQRLYETELEKKQFEVSLLQSQINSHFLYNTLSCIRAMSRKGAEEEVSSMITCLVGMLRYASNMQEKSVIQDEFNNIKNYVFIQRMRLGEQLQLIFDAKDDILLYEIPKMTLQPVVENSILHGFDGGKESWTIKISAIMKGDDIEIRVIDNGDGMDKEDLDKLNSSLRQKKNIFETDNNKNSIGLTNIQNRIHSLYGENYGITVKSNKGFGTAVIIKIPSKRSEDYVFGTFDR